VLYPLLNRINSILSDERGSTFIESGLWIGLVVLVMAGAGIVLAGKLKGNYNTIGNTLDSTADKFGEIPTE
jgi:Flp pilus assembly pilin Flp